MHSQAAQQYLKEFIAQHFPEVAIGTFDQSTDDPNFAVDLTYKPLPEMVTPLG